MSNPTLPRRATKDTSGRGLRPDDCRINEWFADQIHLLRKKRGHTQAELAVRLGISLRTVEKVETGNVTVRKDVFDRFNHWWTITKIEMEGAV